MRFTVDAHVQKCVHDGDVVTPERTDGGEAFRLGASAIMGASIFFSLNGALFQTCESRDSYAWASSRVRQLDNYDLPHNRKPTKAG